MEDVTLQIHPGNFFKEVHICFYGPDMMKSIFSKTIRWHLNFGDICWTLFSVSLKVKAGILCTWCGVFNRTLEWHCLSAIAWRLGVVGMVVCIFFVPKAWGRRAEDRSKSLLKEAGIYVKSYPHKKDGDRNTGAIVEIIQKFSFCCTKEILRLFLTELVLICIPTNSV